MQVCKLLLLFIVFAFLSIAAAAQDCGPAPAPSPTTLADLRSNNTAVPNNFNGSVTDIDGVVYPNFLPSVVNTAVSSENIHCLITYQGSSGDPDSPTSINPRILVHMQGWFCDFDDPNTSSKNCNSHVLIGPSGSGYDDHDQAHVRAQIDDMMRRGIDGMIVLWKGVNSFADVSAKLYRDEAENICAAGGNPDPCPFQVIVMDSQNHIGGDYEDCDSPGHSSCTTIFTNHLNYIYNNFYKKPDGSRRHTALWRPDVNGRPIFLNYELELNYPGINFTSAQQAVGFNPYLVYVFYTFTSSVKDTRPFANGYFNWVSPRGRDCQKSPYQCNTGDPNDENLSGTGTGNLDTFYNYTGFPSTYPIEIGSAYAGFDDRAAQWPLVGHNRKSNRKCGKTWLDTINSINTHFGPSQTPAELDYLQLTTWDDYEEGSELETGVSNCLNSVTGSVSGNTLTANFSWAAHDPNDLNAVDSETPKLATVRRFDVYYSTSNPANATSDSQVNLTYAGSAENTATGAGPVSINLASTNFSFPPGQLWLFVNAVGKAFIQNHINTRTNAISYNNGCGVTLLPSTFDFGGQAAGSTSPAHAFQLTNSCTGALTGLVIMTTGDFAQTNGCGSSLAGGASCTINTTFTPTATGVRSGTLKATYSSGSKTASLSGTGTASGGTDLSAGPWTISGSAASAVTDTAKQLDGASMRFDYTGGGAFSAGLWNMTPSTDYSTTSQFTLDFWANMATPDRPQAFEVKADQIVGGKQYAFKFECDFKSSGKWRLWDPSISGFIPSTVACTPLTANDWTHFTLRFERTADGQLHYQDIIIDGVLYSFNVFKPAIVNAASPTLTVRVRLVGDNAPQTYSMWIDQMTLSPRTVNGAFDIDNRNWTCSNNCQPAVTDTSIQKDGSSKKFSYTGGAAFSSGQWITTLTENFTAGTDFTLDFWGYMSNPGVSQAFEVKADQIVGGREYGFSLQCSIAGKGTGKWRVWNPPATSWVDTTAPCNPLPANTWTHFTIRFQRAGSNQLHYQDVTVGANTYPLNVFANSTVNTGNSTMTVRVKLVGDGTGTAYPFWVDLMSLTF